MVNVYSDLVGADNNSPIISLFRILLNFPDLAFNSIHPSIPTFSMLPSFHFILAQGLLNSSLSPLAPEHNSKLFLPIGQYLLSEPHHLIIHAYDHTAIALSLHISSPCPSSLIINYTVTTTKSPISPTYYNNKQTSRMQWEIKGNSTSLVPLSGDPPCCPPSSSPYCRPVHPSCAADYGNSAPTSSLSTRQSRRPSQSQTSQRCAPTNCHPPVHRPSPLDHVRDYADAPSGSAGTS